MQFWLYVPSLGNNLDEKKSFIIGLPTATFVVQTKSATALHLQVKTPPI